MNYVEVLNYRVYSDSLSHIPLRNEKCNVINTISPNSYGIATKDKEFDSALKTADYLVLDGVYFAIASLLLRGKNIKANQGPDVFSHFMMRAQTEKGRVFFLGSTEQTLYRIKKRAAAEYSDVILDYYSPPFKPQFDENDNIAIFEKINTFKPDIVFIGMTCPKQEKWAISSKKYLDAGLAICIGNVFDWFAGTQKPIAPIWFKLKLGWFIRILFRPEIFKRNIKNQMTFFWHVILIFLKLKKI